MVDMNIEFFAILVLLSVLMPVLLMTFVKSEKRIMLDMTLLIVGVFWIILFGFTFDNIILGYNEVSRNYNSTSGDVTIDNEPILIPLKDDSGVPTQYGMIFMFFSAIWIFIAMFSVYNRR